MRQAAEGLAVLVGKAAACRALGLPRASFYRHQQLKDGIVGESAPTKGKSGRALSDSECQAVLDVLHSDRFVDQAPREVYATLLDEGRYLCSVSTMYRLLAEHGEVRERRYQLVHPAYHKPELLATAPNQVWSWDITKLLGLVKWCHFYLYVILDIPRSARDSVFSRYVVGWMVATRESAALAQRFILRWAQDSVQATCAKQGIAPGKLTIYADRGSSMTSKPVAFLLADLGVTKTHSRPHTSNDNPFGKLRASLIPKRSSRR